MKQVRPTLIAFAALAALAGTAAKAQDADTQRQARGAALRAACQADLDKYCADVEGHGRFRCLRDHHDQVSDGCRSALDAARSWRREHGEGEAGGGSPPMAPGPAPAPPSPAPN